MANGRQFEIFIRNAQDEYITTVSPHTPPSAAVRRGYDEYTDPTEAWPSKCVVVDYTRDPEVLGTKAEAVGAMTLVSVKDHDKLKSFREYLRGRRKAGVVPLPGGGGKLFLLPYVDVACLSPGENIVCTMQPATAYGPRGPSAQAPPALAAPSAIASGDRGGAGIGGFLGSLMGTLNQMNETVADPATVDRVSRAQDQAIKKKVERFKVEVQEKLAAFAMDTDPSSVSHAFPHVEKSLRYIQHVLAEDFEGITSRTEGDVDDRHVVVYKLGYEPPEEEVQLDAKVHVTAPARTSRAPAHASLAPVPTKISKRGEADGSDGGASREKKSERVGFVDTADLVPIGTVIKDRRTVQDIEEEARESKRRKGLDGESVGGSDTAHD